jgi:hypothetical protein
MSPRPLAQGHRELMTQHQDLGVPPPPLPPRQAQQRHGPGDDEEDQLQAHKPKIIARQPEPDLPAGTVRVTEPTASRKASAQVAQVFGTHRRGEQAGVDVWPHRFRHHFSHTWLDRGGAEGDLMELNGWSSPQMLQRYGGSVRGARARRHYDLIMRD